MVRAFARMACPEGIEPPTHSLEGCCSIQLSYGQRSRENDGRGERIRTFDPLVPNQMRYQAALRPDFTIVMAQLSISRLGPLVQKLLFDSAGIQSLANSKNPAKLDK